MLRLTVHFTGRVQGVGFRATARHLAHDHDVTGHVENLEDGRVRLVAEGKPGAVRGYIDAVRAAMGSNITRVDQRESEATGDFADFHIRH